MPASIVEFISRHPALQVWGTPECRIKLLFYTVEHSVTWRTQWFSSDVSSSSDATSHADLLKIMVVGVAGPSQMHCTRDLDSKQLAAG